jgi:hypothetical protein
MVASIPAFLGACNVIGCDKPPRREDILFTDWFLAADLEPAIR